MTRLLAELIHRRKVQFKGRTTRDNQELSFLLRRTDLAIGWTTRTQGQAVFQANYSPQRNLELSALPGTQIILLEPGINASGGNHNGMVNFRSMHLDPSQLMEPREERLILGKGRSYDSVSYIMHYEIEGNHKGEYHLVVRF